MDHAEVKIAVFILGEGFTLKHLQKLFIIIIIICSSSSSILLLERCLGSVLHSKRQLDYPRSKTALIKSIITYCITVHLTRDLAVCFSY